MEKLYYRFISTTPGVIEADNLQADSEYAWEACLREIAIQSHKYRELYLILYKEMYEEFCNANWHKAVPLDLKSTKEIPIIQYISPHGVFYIVEDVYKERLVDVLAKVDKNE